MVCANCLRESCEKCVDITLILAGRSPFCECQRANHSQEPNQAQIQDPETGTVYGPGLKVDIDGKVERL